MDDRLYLGIDLGTSATKAVLADPAGRVVARGSASHPDTRTLGPGRVDPAPWQRSVVEACAALGPARARAVAVGLAMHAPVALFLDANGLPLGPGVGWDHPELAAHCADAGRLRTRAEAELVGNQAFPATTMAMAWPVALRERPDLADRCATFGFVGTWLGQFLTGRPVLDPTQASYAGLMASTDGSQRWLDDLAVRLGVPRNLLPEIRPSLSVLGELTEPAGGLLGVPPGIPVAVGGADTAAAAYLLDLDEDGRALYTVGTTHVITTGRRAPDPMPAAISRAHIVPGRWLSHGATNGGDALALGARLLGHGGGDAVRSMIAAAGAARRDEVEDAPVFIPHVTAERGPLWLERPRSAIIGLLPTTGAAAAAWGMTEGVVFASRLVLEMVSADLPATDQADLPVTDPAGRSVLLTGNFGVDGALSQLVADLLGRPVDLVVESHLPAVGAAAIAVAATQGGRLPAPPVTRIMPRPEWAPTVARRWQRFAREWSVTVGRPFPVACGRRAVR
jgi:xylulokinase